MRIVLSGSRGQGVDCGSRFILIIIIFFDLFKIKNHTNNIVKNFVDKYDIIVYNIIGRYDIIV